MGYDIILICFYYINDMKKQNAQSSKPQSIRQTTAQFMTNVAKAAYKSDMMSWEELGAIKWSMKELAKTGLLPQEPEKRLLDLHQVAKKLAIGESTLKRLLAKDAIVLPKVRIGGALRFRLADVERLVDSVEDAPKGDDETT